MSTDDASENEWAHTTLLPSLRFYNFRVKFKHTLSTHVVAAIFMRFSHFSCRRLAKLFYSSRTYYYGTLLQYKTYRTVMYKHNTVRYSTSTVQWYSTVPYTTVLNGNTNYVTQSVPLHKIRASSSQIHHIQINKILVYPNLYRQIWIHGNRGSLQQHDALPFDHIWIEHTVRCPSTAELELIHRFVGYIYV
jgi:hypothetical protein